MALTISRFRLLAAVGVGAAGLWALMPYATGYVSTQAVVNAPLNTVLSPIRGRIAQGSARAGSGIGAGATLVVIEAAERDRRHLTELRARMTQLDGARTSIDREAARLRDLQAVLEERIRDYRARMVERFAALARETAAEKTAAEAELRRSAAMLARTSRLSSNGHASEMQAETEEARHSEAEAEVARLAARLERVGVEAAAAGAGLFIQDGWSDAPYSQQRLDEIALRLVGIEADRRRVESERATIGAQVAAEDSLIAARETFRPLAPAAGVIWRQSGTAGETVVPGDVLVQFVDCSARFVEVTLPERHFSVIAPGTPAWIRLKGGGAPVVAEVAAVLGAGAKFDHPRLAANVPEARPGQLRALVALGTSALDGEPGAFCHVGRTAEVRFPGGGDGGIGNRVRAAAGRMLAAIAALLPGPAAAAPRAGTR